MVSGSGHKFNRKKVNKVNNWRGDQGGLEVLKTEFVQLGEPEKMYF